MNLLCFDTSSNWITVAMQVDNEVLCHQEPSIKSQLNQLPSLMASLMKEYKITLACFDMIAFVEGPGSFTGLRISAAFAQALAFGLSLKLVPLSSLQALAQSVKDSTRLMAVAIDARMQEFYYGLYEMDITTNIALPANPIALLSALEIQAQLPEGVSHVGGAWPLIFNQDNEYVSVANVAPTSLIELARFYSETDRVISPMQVKPLYIRNKVVN